MKKILIFALIFIAIVGGVFIGFFINRKEPTKLVESSNPIQKLNEVVIIDGKIENEDLIDEFFNNLSEEKAELNIKEDDKNIKIEFIAGQNMIVINSEESGRIDVGDGSFESNKKLYGYYSIYRNGQLSRELPLPTWYLKRVTKDDKVILRFESIGEIAHEEDLPVVCEYDLKSSNYKNKFSLNYNRRKDLEIKKIYDAGDYKIKSFGGDVDIVIEEDMVYSLKDALDNIITPEDIMEKIENDAKYGICYVGEFSDGGSKEYIYDKYTILKLNTLDGDKDLIIGMQGSIINAYKEQSKKD